MLTQTDRINRIIIKGGGSGMTERQFFAAELKSWLGSRRRKQQLDGTRYYEGHHDILHRHREIIGVDGQLEIVENLPNNQVVDNQFAKMVDQKTNYLVGKPITVSGENKAYVEALSEIFNKRFQRTLKYICEDALLTSIGWLYPYYDQEGVLQFQHFPGYSVLPFWSDDDHTQLDCAIRYYTQEVWEGMTKKLVQRVELFRPEGLDRFIFEGDMLIPDVELGEHSDYMITADGQGMNWDRIPLIPFKYNKQEIPLLNRVKSLQDAINVMLSDFMNNMQEDSRNTILVIKDYDGENLAEFRKNLSAYGAVKVRGEGGVSTLQVEVSSENYKAILDLLKKSLIENARGYDAKDDRLSGNPNQMNIQSMYSDIDLDANGMETEFQAAFEDLLWFLNCHLANTGAGVFDEDVTIVFNRDILINETEAISNCQSSVGLLSDETIVSQHPWVTDVELELDRLKKEKEEAMETYQGAFGQQQPGQQQNQNGQNPSDGEGEPE